MNIILVSQVNALRFLGPFVLRREWKG